MSTKYFFIFTYKMHNDEPYKRIMNNFLTLYTQYFVTFYLIKNWNLLKLLKNISKSSQILHSKKACMNLLVSRTLSHQVTS